MRSMISAVMLLAAASFPTALAQEPGSASSGFAYAKERCADCHAIDVQTERSPVRSAPTFKKIANTPGMTPMALTAWLHSSHKTMPDLIVKGDDLDNLVAYIRSLKTPAPDQQ